MESNPNPDPPEVAEPSPPVDQEIPPPDYEPQTGLREGQSEEIVERETDLVEEIENSNPDDADPAQGAADEGDDDADDND